MFFNLKLCFCILFTILTNVSLLAQNGDTLEIQRSNNSIRFARLKPDKTGKRTMQNAQQVLHDVFVAGDDINFKHIKTSTDNLGITHKTFQQEFKGIPVEGAQVFVHGKNPNIEVINGDFIVLAGNPIIPEISEQSALTKALKYINAQKYKWEDSALEQFKKTLTKSSAASYYPKAELVISKDIFLTDNIWRLSYKFIISALYPESEQLVYVDAITGNILNKITLICTVNTPGTVQTRYSGARNMIGDSFVGGFRLREDRNGVDLRTLNMQSGANYANAIDFTDNDNNWSAAEHANNAEDQVALDVHWATEQILDYWRIVHNRNSIDANGMQVLNYVHFNTNWDNAQWDGTANVMRYGDGTFFSPLTSLDVCAHEFAHGVDQFESNLVFQRESGALDEGFADIWGAVIENWADPTKEHWVIGEELTGGPIRSMSNPGQWGQPDTRGGANWFNVVGCAPDGSNDWCGVHTNSGVLNYCFFLLSDGGTGTNDIGNVFNVAGIGIDNAARIAYRAESVYLTSNATFDDARNAFINSARDLFGENSCEFISTMNAWFAVGVGAAYTGNAGLVINGDNIFCSPTSNLYTIPNLPVGATVQWNAFPEGIGVINSPNSSQTTLSVGNNGTITLTATISSFCGVQLTISKSNIVVGTGPVPTITQLNFDRRCGTFAEAYSNNVIGATGYVWDLNFGQVIQENDFPGGNYFYSAPLVHNPRRNLTYYNYLSVQAKNQCGLSDPSPLRQLTVGPVPSSCGEGGPMLRVAPNPSSGGNTIASIKDDKTGEEKDITQIRLIDKTGNLIRQWNYGAGNKKITVNVSGLKSDVYIIMATSDGKEWLSTQLKVE